MKVTADAGGVSVAHRIACGLRRVTTPGMVTCMSGSFACDSSTIARSMMLVVV